MLKRIAEQACTSIRIDHNDLVRLPGQQPQHSRDCFLI
jgi:hypothetical protein